ncbi:thiolase C-terminal domain-containing protein [Phenylobacterium sp.]|jgi:acetyl-CoA acetyltransferase|uniref:thiolase C-terminal domain-containing protein n=1 Tax=Phenylobacterium sp. TaxID=1871053 RepID=UPI002F3F26FF
MVVPLTLTAIAGVGETDYSANSGRSELRLAAEASLAAIRDAGLTPADIDGVVTFTFDSNDELELQRSLGIPSLRWTSRTPFGGSGANATVQQAAAAVASGAAKAVLIYRAFNERSGRRFGTPESHAGFGMGGRKLDFHYTLNLNTAAKSYALENQPYLTRYGITSEDLGRYVVSTRDWAATNPRAAYYQRPLTLEEHQASRWIVEPIIRRWDCCLETDGGAALVITSLDRARDLKQPVVRIHAATQQHDIHSRIIYDVYRSDAEVAAEAQAMNDELQRQSGIRPHEVNVAMIYDAFTPGVLKALEERGFCGPGEAKDFIAAGHTGRGGSMPVNPNGGLMGEAYIHGINNIVEGARQIRGQAVNQQANVERVLVSGGSALILGTP